ncbi:MAG: hypothetical protein WBA10_07495 [Elainellaceae cyanobacterium]
MGNTIQPDGSDSSLVATRERRWLLVLSSLLLVLGSIQASAHGLFHYPGNVPQFLIGIAIMGLGYSLSWRLLDAPLSAAWFWAIAVATRLIFLPMYPGSDIWRYLWEGAIQLQGFSPYEQAPSAPELLPYRTGWWPLINNADVSAIYPPVTQFGFRLLAALTQPMQGDGTVSLLAFKLAFMAADVGICWLLWRRFGTRAMLYGWNPLVIYSFAGGGHYDSWLILPLVAAWLWSEEAPHPPILGEPDLEPKAGKGLRQWTALWWPSHDSPASGTPLVTGGRGHPYVQGSCKTFLGIDSIGLKGRLVQAVLIGISIGVKWITLPALAFLSWRALVGNTAGRWERATTPMMIRFAIAALVFLVGLLPMALSALVYCDSMSCSLVPTSSTFVVSARTAEFLPHFIGMLWPASLESNRLLALPLGAVTLVLLVWCRSLGQFALSYLIALLMLSPIVHAWYFTWMIPFAVRRDGPGCSVGNWGPIWGSLSVFVYFVWTGQQVGDFGWFAEWGERPLIWGPLVLGCLWTGYRHRVAL